MKRLTLAILALLATAPVMAQVVNPSIISVSTAPSGSCTAGLPNQQVLSTGVQYSCQGGTWAAIAGGGGSGTVTQFTAGALSPLFTTSVATGTTTPALSFTLSTAAQNAFFAGPSTGGTGAPSFRAIVAADIPTAIPIANIGSAGLSGTSPITINAAGAIGCATCSTTSGTVTGVSGTANQIDVANGTTTPVISFDANALSSLGGAPLASPTFTGTVTIPGGASISGFAPLASPVLTGNPTAPTQTTTDNSTKLATDAFVQNVANVLTWNNSQVGAVTTAEGTAPTTNQIKVASVYVPQPWTASNLVWSVTTADNSTNTYDFGLYGPNCQAGATNVPLVAHIGSTLGSTFASTTGRQHGSITGGPVTGAAGYYCLAWTSGGGTPAAVLGGATASNYAPFAVATAVSQTSTGGALPSTITAPATALTANSPIVFVQVY